MMVSRVLKGYIIAVYRGVLLWLFLIAEGGEVGVIWRRFQRGGDTSSNDGYSITSEISGIDLSRIGLVFELPKA